MSYIGPLRRPDAFPRRLRATSIARPAFSLAVFLKNLLQAPRPGVITGAADDDPSGIATYSQAGAQFGFGLLWTVVLTWPLMVAVQSVSARIGRVTGHGLAANMRAVFPRPVVLALVALLFVANTINIGADLAAMGAAAELVPAAASISSRSRFARASLVLQRLHPLSPLCRAS